MLLPSVQPETLRIQRGACFCPFAAGGGRPGTTVNGPALSDEDLDPVTAAGLQAGPGEWDDERWNQLESLAAELQGMTPFSMPAEGTSSSQMRHFTGFWNLFLMAKSGLQLGQFVPMSLAVLGLFDEGLATCPARSWKHFRAAEVWSQRRPTLDHIGLPACCQGRALGSVFPGRQSLAGVDLEASYCPSIDGSVMLEENINGCLCYLVSLVFGFCDF